MVKNGNKNEKKVEYYVKTFLRQNRIRKLKIVSSQEKRKKLARTINFTFHYIDDVLSLNNSRFGDFVDRIYPIVLEIKDTTDTAMSASYLHLHLEIDNEGRLRTKLYDKRDYFNFPL